MERQFDLLQSRAVAFDKERFKQAQRVLLGRRGAQDQEALLLSPAHGQDPVRRGCCKRFLPVEVILVLDPLVFLIAQDPGLQGPY